MRTKFTGLLLLCALATWAQETTTDKAFNFGPMFRLHGFYPVSLGANYLNGSNQSQISVGGNLSLFEYRKFRLAFGVDHAFYKTNDVNLAADIRKTRYSSFYFMGTYTVPVTSDLSISPYVGGGWCEQVFKRHEGRVINNDGTIDKQKGSEYRLGFYLDYKVDPHVSLYAGANYVGANFRINTVPELIDYFGKAQTLQICVGIKLGYTMNDKRRDRASNQNQ